MKFYNFNAIKEVGDCREFVRNVLGIPVDHEGRCAAIWRGGSNPKSVALTKDEWCDHACDGGGSIIDLCAVTKFGSTSMSAMQQAQEFLGEYYHLEPTRLSAAPSSAPCRYDDLIAQGYRDVKRYDYCDLDGKVIHTVIRLEHPDKEHFKKEFVQRTPDHWGVDIEDLILYNLSEISGSDWVIMVEGEKDADTLIALGAPATTVCGGAKKWQKRYVEHFRGKDAILIADNDAPGMIHVRRTAADIIGEAKSLKILTVSKLPKGDVTDFMTLEGGTWEQLVQMIREAPLVSAEDLSCAVDDFAVETAKKANKYDFCNFIPVEKEQGKRKIVDKVPKQLNDLIDDVHGRFLGFPRKVGEQMFDHDRDTDDISYFYKQDSLFAWISRKSKKKIQWSKNEGCVTRGELYEGLLAAARRYESVSYVPDWPKRNDVYYVCGELPEPHPEHRYFYDLVDMFNPVDEINRTFLMAFIAAPLFFIHGVPRPLWIIDSAEGQGVGKSTLPQMIARLYGNGRHGGEAVRTGKQELRYNYGEVIKRLVSSEGREARMLLLDNITGEFKSAELADMITSSSISGKAPYGRGEESRPNNLTYVITANSATVDSDLADRAFFIMLKKAPRNEDWTKQMLAMIKEKRFHIFADIIDILERHQKFQNMRPVTRFPEFETKILQAFCRDESEYQQLIERLMENRDDANLEEDVAKRIEEIIREELINVATIPVLNPDEDKIFIRTDVINKWFKNEPTTADGDPVQIIRNLAKTRRLARVCPTVRRYPHHGEKRRSGILWNPDINKTARVVGFGISHKINEIRDI